MHVTSSGCRRAGTVAGRRAVLLAVLASLAGAVGGAGPQAVAAQEYLYVASQEDVTVAVIDMEAKRLVETVDLKRLGFSPTAKAHHTAVEPDGSYWYVSLIADGKVLKFDRGNRLVGQVDFETPGMLALDPASDLLYVGRSMAAVNPPQRIGVVDRTAMTLEEVDIFFPRPHALAVDPVGARFYSASLGQNSVAYADVGAEDVDLLEVPGPGHMLVQFAVAPTGGWMVAGGQMSGDLLVFDLTRDEPEVVAALAVGGQPWHPSVTRDGREVWVPNQSAHSVTVVDTESWTISDVIRHDAIVEPHGSAISADGSTVFVSSHNLSGAYASREGKDRPGTVVAIDRTSREVVAVIEVGPYAAGMATARGR